jgi:Phage integrase family
MEGTPRRRRRRPANKGHHYPAEILTPDEVRALITACSNRAPTGVRNRALIVLLYRAGCRISEALRLLPKDLDRTAGTVTVLRGKGGRRRTRHGGGRFCPSRGHGGSPGLRPSARGSPPGRLRGRATARHADEGLGALRALLQGPVVRRSLGRLDSISRRRTLRRRQPRPRSLRVRPAASSRSQSAVAGRSRPDFAAPVVRRARLACAKPGRLGSGFRPSARARSGWSPRSSRPGLVANCDLQAVVEAGIE